MILTEARVVEITKITPKYYYLLLAEPQIASMASPGQFVHIRIGNGLHPLLRRPFSIARSFPQEGMFVIIFRLVGEGTRILSLLSEGEYVDCLGPLGNGFRPQKRASFSLLVAGGAGIAPLLFLADNLRQRKKEVLLLYGASSEKELIPLEKFLPVDETPGFTSGSKIDIIRATEDGSLGFKGRVTELFAKILEGGRAPEEIFACGPRPMLQALTEENSRFCYPLQLSLEEHMACAIGACQGCAVKIKKGGSITFVSVCRDGPVFYSHEVIW